MYDEWPTLAPGEIRAAPVLTCAATGPLELAWQPTLLEVGSEVVGSRPDSTFATLRRRQLDASSWVDHAPGWLSGTDAVFADLAATAQWAARTVLMYGAEVAEPRLTARWSPGSEPPVLAEIRDELSRRYDVALDNVGVNLYRDGRDSVAWHRDRVHKTQLEPTVATITLGAARRFALRPLGGGPTVTLLPHAGDLVVMGGRCQQDFVHAVPKTKKPVGPRMAITVRHAGEQRSS